MRIGEILRNDGVLTSWQLEAALRTQAQYGGRFVSTAIELGYVDPDIAARALGRQLHVPAALQKHFASIEPHAVARFTPKIAEKYQAIPLGYSSKQARTLIVAFVDPTQLAAIDEIQFLVGSRVLASVAPELRIARALERHYGIAPRRQHDFVRLEPPAASGQEPEFESSKHAYAPVLTPPPAPPPSYRRSASRPDLTAPISEPRIPEPRSLSPMSLPPLASMPRETSDHPVPPSGVVTSEQRLARSRADTKQEIAPTTAERRDQRTATPSVVPARKSRMPSRAPDPRADPAEEKRTPTTPERPATRAPPPEQPMGWSMPPRMPPPPEPVERPALSAGEAIESIRRAGSREVVGQALVDFLRSSFGCAALLVTRNDVALGWKGFPAAVEGSSVDSSRAIASLALPLTQPSILARAYEARSIIRSAPPRDGDEIHEKLFKALATPAPREAVVAPISVGDRVVTLVYAQAFDLGVLSSTVVRELASVCAAASGAYLRLIQDARGSAPS